MQMLYIKYFYDCVGIIQTKQSGQFITTNDVDLVRNNSIDNYITMIILTNCCLEKGEIIIFKKTLDKDQSYL